MSEEATPLCANCGHYRQENFVGYCLLTNKTLVCNVAGCAGFADRPEGDAGSEKKFTRVRLYTETELEAAIHAKIDGLGAAYKKAISANKSIYEDALKKHQENYDKSTKALKDEYEKLVLGHHEKGVMFWILATIIYGSVAYTVFKLIVEPLFL